MYEDHMCILTRVESTTQDKIFCFSKTTALQAVESSAISPLAIYSERGSFLDIQQQPQVISSQAALPPQFIFALAPHTVFAIHASADTSGVYWTRDIFPSSAAATRRPPWTSLPLEYAGGTFESLTAFSVHAHPIDRQVYMLLVDRSAQQKNVFYFADNAHIWAFDAIFPAINDENATTTMILNKEPISRLSLQVGVSGQRSIAFLAQSASTSTHFLFAYADMTNASSFRCVDLNIDELNPLQAQPQLEPEPKQQKIITAFALISIHTHYQIWIAQKNPLLIYQIEFPISYLHQINNMFWKTYTNVVSFTMPYELHQISLSHTVSVVIGENLNQSYNGQESNHTIIAITDQMFRPNTINLAYDKIFCGSQHSQYSFNPCSPGYIAYHQPPKPSVCIASPRGGYAYLSAFVKCPLGTHNPNTGSTHPDACIRCPPGYATFSSSSMCSACNQTHQHQSQDGSTCVSYPENNITYTYNDQSNSSLKQSILDMKPRQNTFVLPHNIWVDFKIQVDDVVWTNEITAIAAFRNSTILVATKNILTEITYKSSSKQQQKSVSFDSLLLSLPRRIQTIDSMIVSSKNEAHMWAADSAAGILLRITNWNFLYPSQCIVFLHAAASDIASITHQPITDTLYFLSGGGRELWALSNASSESEPQLLQRQTDAIVFIASPQNQEVLYAAFDDDSTQLWQCVVETRGATSLTRKALVWQALSENNDSMISRFYEIADDAWVIVLKDTAHEIQCIHLRFNQTLIQAKYSSPNMQAWQSTTIATNIAMSSSTQAKNSNTNQGGSIVYGSLRAASRIQKDSNMLIYAWADSDTVDIHILYQRPVECPAGSFLSSSSTINIKECVPCAQATTTSMTGATDCTACPIGFYRPEKTQSIHAACTACPPHYWWTLDSQTDSCENSEIGACRTLMASRHDPTDNQAMYFLREARNLFEQPRHENWIMRASTAADESLRNPYYMDSQGKFWQSQSLFFRETNFLTAPTQFRASGMWIPCQNNNKAPDMPQETCACSVLSEEMSWGDPWDAARREAAKIHNSSSKLPFFLLRMHTEHSHNRENLQLMFPPDAAAETHNMSSNYTTTDTGTCWIGWPPIYHCMDPRYFFDIRSLQCAMCPNGTSAPNPSAMQCESPTTTANTFWCPPGTYAFYYDPSYRKNHTCMPCPLNTYSTASHSTSCTPKIQRCPDGHYLQETYSAIRDHSCVLCEACDSTTSVMFPYDWQSNLLRCNGTIRALPYTCVPLSQSMKSFSMAVLQYDMFTYRTFFYSCSTTFASSLRVYYQWARGPYPDLCYLECRFGIHEPSLQAYYQAFTQHAGQHHLYKLQHPELIQSKKVPFVNPGVAGQQQNSASLSVMQERLSTVCSPCDLSACPDLMWRPIYSDGCGAPCFASPELCSPNRTDGCVVWCEKPENSRFLTYSRENSTCTWECNRGWYTDDAKTQCLACGDCPAGTSYVGDSNCLPHMTFSSVCQGCVSAPHLLPLGVNLSANQSEPGKCTYECFREGELFFKNTNPLTNASMPCLACRHSAMIPSYVCPHGHMPSPCTIEPCIPCSFDIGVSEGIIPSYSYTAFSSSLMLNSKSRNPNPCRIFCDAMHNTINLTSEQHDVIPFPQATSIYGYDPAEVECQPCSNRQNVECTAIKTCEGPHFTLSIVVPETCEPCKDAFQMGCQATTRAPPCLGGRSIQAACVMCPTPTPASLLFFVTYQSALQNFQEKGGRGVYTHQQSDFLRWTTLAQVPTTSTWACPTACPLNTILVNGSACVDCNVLYPKPPSHFPYSQYFSLWNASRARRWWDAAFDPPHLGPRLYQPSNGQLVLEARAGICWPCSQAAVSQSEAQTGSHILCANDMTQNNEGLPMTTTPPPDISSSQSSGLGSLDSIIGAQVNPPTPNRQPPRRPIAVNNKKRRRLLSQDSSDTPPLDKSIEWLQRTKTTAPVIQRRGLAVTACPEGYYQAPPYGYWCEKCPPNYDCSTRATHAKPNAVASIPNTQIQTSMSLLSWSYHMRVYRVCKPGFYRLAQSLLDAVVDLTQQPCIPCPPGTYEYQDTCYPCPPFSSSAAGQTQCSCPSSDTHQAIYQNLTFLPMQKAQEEWTEARLLECRPLQNPSQNPRQIQCAHDHNAVYNELRGSCVCPPGFQFFELQIQSRLVCMPCLPGTYSATFGLGPCTPCPRTRDMAMARTVGWSLRNSIASCY